jgi:antirestriction protein ArdC
LARSRHFSSDGIETACFSAEAGISNAVPANQAAYVAGWLNRLRDDHKLIVHAATQAQRAADYILDRRPSE